VNAREKVSLKSGDIKLFMMPQEVALVMNCLNWVQTEMVYAADAWERTGMATEVDREMLRYYIPIIKSTLESILLHSTCHYEERKDKSGMLLLKAMMNKMHDDTKPILERVHYVIKSLGGNSIRTQN